MLFENVMIAINFFAFGFFLSSWKNAVKIKNFIKWINIKIYDFPETKDEIISNKVFTEIAFKLIDLFK